MQQAGKSRFLIPNEVNLFQFPAALGPRVYSASNRNEYQKQKNNNVSLEQSATGV
jgi:hypothetical protein